MGEFLIYLIQGIKISAEETADILLENSISNLNHTERAEY